SSSVSTEVATPVMDRPPATRSPSARTNADAVEPVPSPTTVPGLTSPAACAPIRSSRAVPCIASTLPQPRRRSGVHDPAQAPVSRTDDLAWERVDVDGSVEHPVQHLGLALAGNEEDDLPGIIDQVRRERQASRVEFRHDVRNA